QTAEGALDETTNMLQRMRVLSIQAANGSNSDSDRGALDKEFTELKAEIDRVSDDTTFGGENLLDGSYDADYQVGADANQVMNLKITTDMNTTGLALSGVTLSSAANAQLAITAL
ncbi:flagellin, partial [Achromobacter sp. SIMBA_011]